MVLSLADTINSIYFIYYYNPIIRIDLSIFYCSLLLSMLIFEIWIDLDDWSSFNILISSLSLLIIYSNDWICALC